MTTQVPFLCTHKSINVSAVYRCSSRLQAYVVQIYSSALEKWLVDKYNLTQCCGSHCCEELYEPLETTTFIPETTLVTLTNVATKTAAGQESEDELRRVTGNDLRYSCESCDDFRRRMTYLCCVSYPHLRSGRASW